MINLDRKVTLKADMNLAKLITLVSCTLLITWKITKLTMVVVGLYYNIEQDIKIHSIRIEQNSKEIDELKNCVYEKNQSWKK